MYVPIMNHFPEFMEIEIFTVTDLINSFLAQVTGYWKKYTHLAIL